MTNDQIKELRGRVASTWRCAEESAYLVGLLDSEIAKMPSQAPAPVDPAPVDPAPPANNNA